MKELNTLVANVDPEDMDIAIKNFMYANRRRASAVRLMDTDWPQAHVIRSMLVSYVGLSIESCGNPLVFSAIDRGALSYERRLGTKPDWLRLTGFLEVTIKGIAKELVGLKVVGAKGNVWLPQSGLPLSTWITKEKEAQIVRGGNPSPNEGALIRSAIMKYLSTHLPKTAQGVFSGR